MPVWTFIVFSGPRDGLLYSALIVCSLPPHAGDTKHCIRLSHGDTLTFWLKIWTLILHHFGCFLFMCVPPAFCLTLFRLFVCFKVCVCASVRADSLFRNANWSFFPPLAVPQSTSVQSVAQRTQKLFSWRDVFFFLF